MVRSHPADGWDRTGEVIDIHRVDGRPPYLVRWDHDRSEVLLFPRSDTFFMRADDGAA